MIKVVKNIISIYILKKLDYITITIPQHLINQLHQLKIPGSTKQLDTQYFINLLDINLFSYDYYTSLITGMISLILLISTLCYCAIKINSLFTKNIRDQYNQNPDILLNQQLPNYEKSIDIAKNKSLTLAIIPIAIIFIAIGITIRFVGSNGIIALSKSIFVTASILAVWFTAIGSCWETTYIELKRTHKDTDITTLDTNIEITYAMGRLLKNLLAPNIILYMIAVSMLAAPTIIKYIMQ